MRLVWDSSVDWRRRAKHFVEPHSRLDFVIWWTNRRLLKRAMDFLPDLLGLEHLHHLSRHGPAQEGRELGCAFRADHDGAFVRLGNLESTRSGLLADSAKQVSHGR